MHARWATVYRPRFRDYLQSTDWWDEFKAGIDEKDGQRKEGLEAVKYLEDKYHGTWDIRGQFIMALICLPLGLVSGFCVLRNCRRHFAADEDGLKGFLPDTIRYPDIETIDRAKWDSKGIVHLYVQQGDGTRKVVLDDWKFQGMAEILEVIEEHRPDLAPADDEEAA
jgi:hypothetical protein